MSAEQRTLQGNVETITGGGRKLKPRQQHAYDWLRAQPGGVYADELGAHMHRHADDQRCEWCARTGHELLRSKALAPLVIRRKSGLWQVRDGGDAERPPAETVERVSAHVPDDPFEGL